MKNICLVVITRGVFESVKDLEKKLLQQRAQNSEMEIIQANRRINERSAARGTEFSTRLRYERLHAG
jgi:hypothetical protein